MSDRSFVEVGARTGCRKSDRGVVRHDVRHERHCLPHSIVVSVVSAAGLNEEKIG
jgi:hypothetical protein